MGPRNLGLHYVEQVQAHYKGPVAHGRAGWTSSMRSAGWTATSWW